jgi:hypothetical protein
MGAITKVGAVAKMAGASIQELEGYTTSLVASTGISGQEAGTALKSIMSRMYRIGPEGEEDAGRAEIVLKRAGVAVRNASGEFRKFGDVLDDIHKIWGTLSNVQQISIAQTVSGVHHYSKFVNLMENYGMAIDATNIALNSQGSAFRENEKYMDSIQGKLAIMNTTIEEKWSQVFNSDQFKFLIETLTKVIDQFVSLGGILRSFLALMLIFKQTAIVGLIEGFKTLVVSMGLYKGGVASAVVATEVLTASQAKAAVGATALKGALGWIGIALLAIQGVTMVFQSYKKGVEEANQSIINLNKTFEGQRAELNSVTTYYEKNHKLIKEDTSVKETLLEMQRKLIESYGKEAQALDLINGKYIDNANLLKRLTAEQARNEVKQTEAVIKSIEEESYRRINIVPSPLGKQVSLMEKGSPNQTIQDRHKELLEIKEAALNHDSSAIDGIKLEYSGWVDLLKDVNEELVVVEAKLEKINSLPTKQKAEYAITRSLGEDSLTSGSSQGKLKAFTHLQDELMEKLIDVNDNLPVDEWKAKYDKIRETIARFDNTNAIELSKELRDLGLSYDIIQEAFKNTAEGGDAPSKPFEKLSEEVKETITDIENLNKVQDDLKKGNKLNSSAMIDLITKYPELIGYIKLTADGYVVEAKGIDIVKKAMLEKQRQALIDEANLSKVVIDNIKSRLGAYGSEVEGINSLSAARELAERARPWSGSLLEKDARDAEVEKDFNVLSHIAKINALIAGLNASPNIPTGKTSASKSALDYLDMADAAIRAFNAEVEKQKLQNESIQRQIKLAEKQKDYNTQLKLTNDLLNAQEKTIKLLKTANDNIHAKANELRAKAKNNDGYKYLQNENIASWFDVNGEATEAYTATVNRDVGKTDKASKDRREEIEKMFKAIYDLKKAWRSNTNEIFSMGDALDATAEKINQINESILRMTQDLQSKMMELRRKQYQGELKEATKAHDEKMDMLDEELSAYQEMIQGKLDALERFNNAEDYDRDIASKNKKILEVQAQIDALALDDSSESMAKKVELQNQLDTLREGKEDAIRKHSRDSEKASLEEMLKNKEKAIDEERELEQNKFDEIKTHFENIMSEEVLLAQTTNELLQKSAEELIAIYGVLFSRFEAGATSAGLAASAQLVENIRAVSSREMIPVEDPNKVVGLRQWLVEKGIADTDITWENGKVHVRGTPIDTTGFQLTEGRFYATIEKIRQSLAKANVSFKTGGYTGDNEGLAYLHRKEIILNQADTKNFLKAIDMTRMMTEKLDSFSGARMMPERTATRIEANFELNVTAPSGADTLEIAKTVEKYVWDNMSRKLSEEGI